MDTLTRIRSVAIFAEAMLGYMLRREEEAGGRIQLRSAYSHATCSVGRAGVNRSGLGVSPARDAEIPVDPAISPRLIRFDIPGYGQVHEVSASFPSGRTSGRVDI